MVDDEQKTMMSVSSEGLHVSSVEISEKLEKKKLSASAVTGLVDSSSCAARWVAESFVIPDLVPDSGDNAASRGTVFHSIMEQFFALQPEDRTKPELVKIAKEVFSREEFSFVRGNKDAQNWVKTLINNYYSMGAKPGAVKIATIQNPKFNPDRPENKWNQKEIVGLEMFVEGKLGNSSRPVLGFIDRLVVDLRDKSGKKLVVEDWKTGAKVKRWNPKTKSEDGLAEARQQTMYAMMLEDMGVEVSGARLLYPAAKEIVSVDCSDENFRKRVVEDVESADWQLSNAISNNTFEYSPSFLCAWCPLAKICPAATIKPYKKMQEAYETQPDSEILRQCFTIV